jgi:hypothetical protein
VARNNTTNVITKNSVAGAAQIVIGYILAIACAIFGIICILAIGLATSTDIIVVIIFFALTALGISLIVRGKKRRELAKLFKEYTARLATDPLRSIDQLAAATGVAVETAKENILEMIDKGYFVNTYVDFDRNCLVFLQEGASPESASTQQSESSVEYASVSCPGCGATNRIRKGTVGECEFCGNPLSEK